MSDREKRTRDAIGDTAKVWREHLQKCGKTVTQEQAERRVRDAHIRHNERER